MCRAPGAAGTCAAGAGAVSALDGVPPTPGARSTNACHPLVISCSAVGANPRTRQTIVTMIMVRLARRRRSDFLRAS